MIRKVAVAAVALLAIAACEQSPTQPDVQAVDAMANSTSVPGQQDRYDADDNGYPDAGNKVNGKYTSIYAYDANGDFYWDLGDGRIQGTVGSIDDLEQSTLTECVYQVQYRGDFGNDPFLDDGWIINNINCRGLEKDTFMYLIVHNTDPRYTGDGLPAFGGGWEYHVLVEGGEGNLARPENAAGS